MIREIQSFFYEERDEEIGIIAAGEVLDFFMENIGIFIYNKALDDAKLWFNKKIDNVEIDFDLLYNKI